MSDSDGALRRIYQRLMLMVGRGRIQTVNDSGSAQKMQVRLGELEIRDNLPRLAEFGFTSNPPSGSDAVVQFIGGDRSNGVVIATGHQQSRPKGLAPGESMLYSQDGKYVYLTASGGFVVEAKGQSVTVNNATTVIINAAVKVRMVTPRLECTGDIVDNCDTTGRSMAADRVIYDSHNHDIHNIQTGGSTVTSNSPNQTE